MKKLALIMIGITLFAASLSYLAPHVLAQTAQDTICTSIGSVSGSTGCADPTGSPNVNSLVAAIINLLSWAVGIVGIVMVIIGAGKYMTSGGDANAISSAKKTIMYALGGLVLAALSQVLVRFVLLRATH